MINNSRLHLINFFSFVANPNNPQYPKISQKEKIKNIFFYFFPIQFIICGIVLWYPVAIAEKLQLFNKLNSTADEEDIFLTIISAVIIAPLIEEWLFRYPLGINRRKYYFKWLYYSLSVLFGLIHIFTYDFDHTHLPYIPFITMTQIVSGFIFGYIRIVYGFLYGILLHSLFNILGVIWHYTIGFSL